MTTSRFAPSGGFSNTKPRRVGGALRKPSKQRPPYKDGQAPRGGRGRYPMLIPFAQRRWQGSHSWVKDQKPNRNSGRSVRFSSQLIDAGNVDDERTSLRRRALDGQLECHRATAGCEG